MLPLPLLEVSHFLSSIAGLLLLLVARGRQRRVETAYYAAAVLLVCGIAASLLKGFDLEEAMLLSVLLAALLPCRRYFYRHGAFLTQRFTVQWFLAFGIVLSCSAWLMLFSFQHVQYRDDLWWQFAFHENAPRSLRAFVGVVTLMLIFTCWLLLATAHDVGPSAGYYGCLGAACNSHSDHWRVLVIASVLVFLTARLIWSLARPAAHGRDLSSDVSHLMAFVLGLRAFEWLA